MKNRTLIFSSILFGLLCYLSVQAFAASPDESGFYLGAEVGYGQVDYEDVTLSAGAQPSFVDDAGLAPAFELGYQFTDYFATELSVIYFHKPKFHDIGVGSTFTGKIKHNLVYLAGRLGIPFKQRFLAYTKLGLGYAVRDSLSSNGQTLLQSGEFVLPVYGLGLLYQVDAHWSLETSWVQSPQHLSVEVPRANFFGLGAVYHF